MEDYLIKKAEHEADLMLEKLRLDLVDNTVISGTLEFPAIAVHPVMDSYDIETLVEQAKQLKRNKDIINTPYEVMAVCLEYLDCITDFLKKNAPNNIEWSEVYFRNKLMTDFKYDIIDKWCNLCFAVDYKRK